MAKRKNGKIKDGIVQRFRSWRLHRKIKKGKEPRGRVNIDTEDDMKDNGKLERNVLVITTAELRAKHIKANGEVVDYGVIANKLVTQAFINYLVDSLQDSSTYPMDAFHYHASGTGTTAESNADTALETEVESRTSGTQTEGSSSNIYKTVATISYSGTYAITEHGIFTAASGGTLMDRSVFSAINVVSGDSIQFTYQCTFNAET